MSTPLQYLNPPPLPPLQGNGDDQSINPFIFNPLFQGTSSSSPPVEQERKDHGRDQQQEGEYQEADKGFSPSGSREDHFLLQTASIRDSIDTKSSTGVKSLCYEGEKDGEKCENASAAKWMSSKMRLMRKMLNSDLNDAKKAGCRREETTFQTWQRSAASDEDNSNNSGSNKIRVCSDCNTTKTPLWRTGPQGPKSLCNACGIRQRKARRAMAAAAAAAAATASGGLLSVDASRTSGSSKAIKHKRSSSGYTTQYKKKCKFGGIPSKEKIQFDEFAMRVNQNSTFHRVFPQDEKEAAMLLMALSYGLVRG